MDRELSHQQQQPQLNPLNARVGMALAYWAYPHKDEAQASKVLPYPESWEHAQPGRELPPDWPTPQYDSSGRLQPGSPEGWNTQHNAQGQLENQFQVSINRETQEITFDFKGSDAWSNWKSDLGNAGASEFAKIQAQAQAAFEHLSQHPEFRHFRFAATGHSLGGGMAQSFALRNNIDAYVYNSLPIARDTVRGDYFSEVGGYEAALARFQASGRVAHDVRTPNDIATHTFEGIMQNRYLSHHAGPGVQWLPGERIPGVIKTALLVSKLGTLPAAALMGKDHTMGALADGQQGLAVDAEGRFRVPHGHQQLAEIPAEARRRLALLEAAPLVRAQRLDMGQDPMEPRRYLLEREDGSRQFIELDPRSAAVEIDHRSADGSRILIEMDGRRHQPVRVTEFDAQGHRIRQDTVAWHQPVSAEPDARRIATAHEAAQPIPWSQRLSETQMHHFMQAVQEIGPHLQERGLSQEQVGRVCAAAVVHCGRHHHPADGQQFMLSHNGETVGILDGGFRLTEMSVSAALRQDIDSHLELAAEQHTCNLTKDNSLHLRAEQGHVPARALA